MDSKERTSWDEFAMVGLNLSISWYFENCSDMPLSGREDTDITLFPHGRIEYVGWWIGPIIQINKDGYPSILVPPPPPPPPQTAPQPPLRDKAGTVSSSVPLN